MIDATATLPPRPASPPALDSVMHLVPPRRDLLRTLADLESHTVFTRLLVAADFSEDLTSGPPLTLFAPTDDALAALDEAAEGWLVRERAEELCDLLEHHLVRGAVDLSEALSHGALGSVHGAALPVDQDAHGIRIGGARLWGVPIPCANGLLVPIDRVLPVPLPVSGWGAPDSLLTLAVEALRSRAEMAAGAPASMGSRPARYPGPADRTPVMDPTTLTPRSEPRPMGNREEARASQLAATMLGLRSS